MQLIQTISMDLAFRGITPRIYGKQDDSGSMRGVRIELFNAGAAYAISSGTTFLLRYKTAQGAIGLYDALPDGASAFSFVAGENTVTATFVDQMFAQPGDVECELRIVDPAGVATTWKWILDVERGNVGDAAIPSDYINAFNVLAASAADAADRAEMAASSLSITSLGTVAATDIVGAATSVEFTAQFAQRYGNIGFVRLTVHATGVSEGKSFGFQLSGIPPAIICVASPGLYPTDPASTAFIVAAPVFDPTPPNGASIFVRVVPASISQNSFVCRFAIVYLIGN